MIKKHIFRGSHDAIYKGTLDGIPVAVKGMKKQEPRRIRAQTLLPSGHPGIVKCFGMYYNKQTEEYMLVMELMKESLWDYLEKVKGRLSVAEQCMICRDIASALVYLHQHDPPIAYCDLCSVRILISFDGQVKLGACSEAQQIPPGGYFFIPACGNLMYLPPETYTEDKRCDVKIDTFLFGAVMYEIATQGLFPNPHTKSDLSKIHEDHPLKPIILQCLQNNPVDRPNSASVLKEVKKTCPVSQRKYHSTHLLI